MEFTQVMSYHAAVAKHDDAREAWRCVAMLFLAPEMQARFHEAAGAAGLPHPGALKLLLTMEADDPPSMRELATFMQCDASWVTALVDALEEAGCVERQVSPNDRRVKRVRLTPHGAVARQRAFEVLAEPPETVDRLTAQETKLLARLLRRLIEA